ncbi:MAG: thiamine phosphate synthase [Clostridia bacterium]|nr:thiamine phosphate synthase [Clostridia bacterium]
MRGTDWLRLYAVTDGKGTPEEQVEKIRKAVAGGVTAVQIREKGDISAFLPYMAEIREICGSRGVPLIINDYVSFALENADGVHLGAEDEGVEETMRRAPKGFIIGATAKTVKAAIRAQEAGADYLGVGAMFPSVTKSDAERMTIDYLKLIRRYVTVPIVAIGGINIDNVRKLEGTGVEGVAVCDGIFGGGDIEKNAASLRKVCDEIFGKQN